MTERRKLIYLRWWLGGLWYRFENSTGDEQVKAMILAAREADDELTAQLEAALAENEETLRKVAEDMESAAKGEK